MSQPKSLRSFDEASNPVEATRDRRAYLADLLGLDLNAVSERIITPEQVFTKNIENHIGEVSVPLGVAGPVVVHGTYAQGERYLPLATTEGALVASISRGCKTLAQSGGVYTTITYKGISRAPLFTVNSLSQIDEITQLVQKQFVHMQSLAQSTSSHLQLINAEVTALGTYVWVRMSFDTQEAMGMNMASTAAEKICDYICKSIADCELIALSGNLCVDKKASWTNIVKGRGYKVTAQSVIPQDVLQHTLHTTAQKMAQVGRAKNWYGSALAGAMSANAQAANVVAALFLATGQDVAHLVESSQAFTIAEEIPEGLRISVTLPNVICGTKGGGTQLPAQHQAMSIAVPDVLKDVDNSHYAWQFAEVLAAGVLAGEVSLLAALCTNTLASAHRQLTGKEPKGGK